VTKSAIVVMDPEAWDTDSTSLIDGMVHERNKARKEQQYEKADELLASIGSQTEKTGMKVRLHDETISWSLLYHHPVVNSTSILAKAHAAVGACASGDEVPDKLISDVVEILDGWHAVQQLLEDSDIPGLRGIAWKELQSMNHTQNMNNWAVVEDQLQGRKAADTAYWFSMAGVKREHLFELLTLVVCKELARFGTRPSCRLQDVLQMTRKLVAAGVKDSAILKQAVGECLQTKAADHIRLDEILEYRSDHVALMLWEYSTRQRQQASFLKMASDLWQNEHRDMYKDVSVSHPSDVTAEFIDDSRPLVVDVGCGLGVSLLGLAAEDASRNYLGVDLNPQLVGYANGLAFRWGLSRHLTFATVDAEKMLLDLLEYPGHIEQILIQFPTPFKFQHHNYTGNAQLPESPYEGFMVSESLLRRAHELLQGKGTPEASLVVASNCEDVAVWIKTLATDTIGFRCSEFNRAFQPDGELSLTQRTENWIQVGGERARGPEWSNTPILSQKALTETEVACILRNIPVHRFLAIP